MINDIKWYLYSILVAYFPACSNLFNHKPLHLNMLIKYANRKYGPLTCINKLQWTLPAWGKHSINEGNLSLLWRLYYLNKGDDKGYSADYMEIAHYVSWGVSCKIIFRIRTGSWTINRRKRSKNAVIFLSPNVCWREEVEYLHCISQRTLNLYILNFLNMFWSLPMGIHILDIL